jgi:hypothetical protein
MGGERLAMQMVTKNEILISGSQSEKYQNDKLWARSIAHVSSSRKHTFVQKLANQLKGPVNEARDLDSA